MNFVLTFVTFVVNGFSLNLFRYNVCNFQKGDNRIFQQPHRLPGYNRFSPDK